MGMGLHCLLMIFLKIIKQQAAFDEVNSTTSEVVEWFSINNLLNERKTKLVQFSLTSAKPVNGNVMVKSEKNRLSVGIQNRRFYTQNCIKSEKSQRYPSKDQDRHWGWLWKSGRDIDGIGGDIGVRNNYYQIIIFAKRRGGNSSGANRKIIVLPGLAILAPPRVYALCLGTGGTALSTALATT
ncbi:hypothetical protein EVAR_5166_1 [Eumeta japonica]|uniref:Uncharacterized protein n=1 Tax=Eumeta variegata TaxID=151549 RepID=A0A4C1SVB1_EUMVA|nr:hypothetical protein EVAR_5166_1 [Eumeta japonica]